MSSTSPRSSRSSKPAAAATPRSRSRTRPATAGSSAPSPSLSELEHRQAAVPEDHRRQWVAEAAYYIAERRGFHGGSPEDDWSRAEAEIALLLASRHH
ncbi:MAG: DUF2934 domain-containing protein [Burkholderiaceae bacterium]|nr:DUF2934 domain-containing protein [Burkholderiaceae bacterium]